MCYISSVPVGIYPHVRTSWHPSLSLLGSGCFDQGHFFTNQMAACAIFPGNKFCNRKKYKIWKEYSKAGLNPMSAAVSARLSFLIFMGFGPGCRFSVRPGYRNKLLALSLHYAHTYIFRYKYLKIFPPLN